MSIVDSSKSQLGITVGGGGLSKQRKRKKLIKFIESWSKYYLGVESKVNERIRREWRQEAHLKHKQESSDQADGMVPELEW